MKRLPLLLFDNESAMFQEQLSSENQNEKVCTYVSELHHADLPQLTDAAVGGLRLKEELGQGHLLTAEQLPHNALLSPQCTKGRMSRGEEGKMTNYNNIKTKRKRDLM